jgi:hypothetical protein
MPDRVGSSTCTSAPVPEAEAGTDEGLTSAAPTRTLGWYGQKAAIEATCLALPCDLALGAAKIVMPDGGLAEQMLDHFRAGEAATVRVDLDRELERNPRLKEFVASRIEAALAERLEVSADPASASGAIWVSQADYGSSEAAVDQRLALGGTFVEYAVVGSGAAGGLEVELNVSDHYFWSPSDATRITQCLHECAAEMVSAGDATEFYQYGEGSLVVADPRSAEPMPSPGVEPAEDR